MILQVMDETFLHHVRILIARRHLEEFKDNWNYELLSSNPMLSIDFVMAHAEKPWDWTRVAMNPSIRNDENMKKYPNLPWGSGGHDKCFEITYKKDALKALLTESKHSIVKIYRLFNYFRMQPWDWQDPHEFINAPVAAKLLDYINNTLENLKKAHAMNVKEKKYIPIALDAGLHPILELVIKTPASRKYYIHTQKVNGVFYPLNLSACPRMVWCDEDEAIMRGMLFNLKCGVRNALFNPSYSACRKRLKREYEDIMEDMSAFRA